MKRIILAFLFLVITPFLLHEDKPVIQQAEEVRKANSENPETANWEYVKDRIFDGETSFFGRLEGPISIIFKEGTKEDSLLLAETVSEIREILPNKEFRILNSFNQLEKNTKSWFYIYFPPESNYYIDPEQEIINLTSGHFIEISPNIRDGNRLKVGESMKAALPEKYHYVNDNPNIKVDYRDMRKRSLKAGLLRKLVLLQNDAYVKGRSVFRKRNITGLDSHVNDRDIFLLQKLYADDFLEQFKDYLYKYYPRRYALSFLDKSKSKLLATGIVFLLGTGILVLLFSAFQRKRFKYSFLNYFIPVFLIIGYIIYLDIIYNYFTRLGSIITWGSMGSALSITALSYALIAAFVMWGADKLIDKRHRKFSLQLVLKILSTFIAFILPLFVFSIWGQQFEWKDLVTTWYFTLALPLGRGILIYLNHFSDSRIKQKDVELSQLQEAKTQSELKLLQSHIDPHFLYNALNSIAGLAHDDADKTENMALSLSDLFRYSLNKKGEKMSTVQEEVDLVENYLAIEQIRFGDRLTFTLSVDDGVKNEQIPMFLLQPLVENAVKHGISKISGPAEINLIIKQEAETLLIIVRDNGPDFPEGLVSGHGLQTVYDLLRLSYGDQADLSWENKPQKQIIITINQDA